MTSFLMSLVSPDRLLFAEEVEQVDLPGTEGDFGVLAGHAPIVALLRPGVVTVMGENNLKRFIVLGGLAEFSHEQLTILAESASGLDQFDTTELKIRIEELQKGLTEKSVGEELDRALTLLDHYRSLHISLGSLSQTTAL